MYNKNRVRCFRVTRAAALVGSGLAAITIGAGVATAAAASASTAPPTVTVSSSSDGSATCTDGIITLTVGAATTTTFAEADVNGVAGTPVPTTEPTFTTDHFSTGSPRWVIELSNGKNLMNNQASSTTPAPPGAADWQVNLNNINLTYANAVAAAVGGATNVTVKDAFIVADGDQAAGTSDKITNATYNDETLTCKAASPSPAPSPSPSKVVPKGGVQTGGGQPGRTNWLPFGLILAALGAVGLGGGTALALRRQRG